MEVFFGLSYQILIILRAGRKFPRYFFNGNSYFRVSLDWESTNDGFLVIIARNTEAKIYSRDFNLL